MICPICRVNFNGSQWHGNRNGKPYLFRRCPNHHEFDEPTMRILWEKYGNSLWHEDCDKSRCGIMVEIHREPERSLLRCLHCEREGYFPVGAISACVPVQSSAALAPKDQP
jgi:hypothetical protein